MSYSKTVAIQLGASRTGLDLAAQLYNSAGVATGAEITTGFAEIGLGNYMLTLTLADGFQGVLSVYEDVADPTWSVVVAIDTIENATASAVASLPAILTSATITAVSPSIPVDDTTRVVLIAGDDYTAAASRPLAWRFTGSGITASLVDTVTLYGITADGLTPVLDGIVGAATQDGDELVVSFDVTSSETENLRGLHIAQILVITTGGNRVTLARPRLDFRQRLWPDA